MAEGIRGVHAYWQLPNRLPRAYQQLSRATWLLSIRSWQRHAGPITLYADPPTIEWLDRLGWLDCYDQTETFDDRDLDKRYDRVACFALPKLLALARYPDAVLVDTDAYLYHRLRLPATGSVFAHLEHGDADFYTGLRELRNPARVELPDSLPTVGNTSLFRAADADLARRISQAGLSFLADNPTTPGRDVHLHMTVAEQVLATHLTTVAGHRVVNAFNALWCPRTLRWLTEPPRFGHLWNLKRGAPAEQLLAAYVSVTRTLWNEYGVAPDRVRAALERT
ncbi:hypothetical protein [Micromonospora sp. C95]|uniref:hypothetical protein n=1 Tax=Micromonospora sp. C95 TaxID=2824882 RepID=UPI001B37A7BE|nr:hypothetical protein [Micromonospora sp. C95]MBQ1023990.1 hypothetical protein [Micromonospora sp. C95]